jgi:hypothetical protein
MAAGARTLTAAVAHRRDAPVQVQGHVSQPMLMRRLAVHEPATTTPSADPSARALTNAEAVEQYLRTMAPDGQIAVDRTTGECRAAPEFCAKRGGWGRFTRGVASGFKTGAKIGAYGLLVGAIPGAIIGALIGGFAGLFGADSQAEESSTPTGSTCVCDFIKLPHTWTIEIKDNERPRTLNNRRVWVPPPNASRTWGAATVGGRLETVAPWLALSHELCGHAWLEERRRASGSDEDEEGVVEGEDARHHRSVERENLIRAEHGLEARGFRLRDPYCGETFYRERRDPPTTVRWPELHDAANQQALREAGRAPEADDTTLDECQMLRVQYLGILARRYRVDQRIPK